MLCWAVGVFVEVVLVLAWWMVSMVLVPVGVLSCVWVIVWWWVWAIGVL